MKKILSVFGVALLAVGILGACSETVEKKEESTPKIEKKAEETKPAPAKTEAPKSTMKDKVNSYRNQMDLPVNGLLDALSDFARLNEEGANNPSLLFSDNWKKDVVVTIVLMDTYLDQLKAINPPAELSDVHQLVLNAVDRYRFVTENYPRAIDNLDANLINECSTNMREGTDFIKQATEKLNSKQ